MATRDFGIFKPGSWPLPRHNRISDYDWVIDLAYKGKLGYWLGPKVASDPDHPYNISNRAYTDKVLKKYLSRGWAIEYEGVYYFPWGKKRKTYQAIEDLHLRLENYLLLDEDDASNREFEAIQENLWGAIEETHFPFTEEQKQAIFEELYKFYSDGDLRWETYISPARVVEIAWVLGFLSNVDFDLENWRTLDDLNVKVERNAIFNQDEISYPITGKIRQFPRKIEIYIDYDLDEEYNTITLCRREG